MQVLPSPTESPTSTPSYRSKILRAFLTASSWNSAISTAERVTVGAVSWSRSSR